MSTTTSNPTGLDFMRMVRDGLVPQAQAAALIGYKLVEVEPGFAALELEPSPTHANMVGTMHGGILCTIADTVMGAAFATSLGPDETQTTLELKINFLKPVRGSKLRAHGNMVRRGRTTGFVECEIFDDLDNLVVKSSATFMILKGDMARGRMFGTK